MTPNELAALIDGEAGLTPSLAEIEAFEAQVGERLPDDYRTFLTLTRGGRPRGRVVFSLAGEEIGAQRIGRVARLCEDEDCSLEERHRTASDCDIPEGLLSIMTDGGGNDIALVLRPDRLGEVFFLDHEVSGGEGAPDFGRERG